MLRTVALVVAVSLVGCATAPHTEHVAPPTPSATPGEGEASGPEHQPEIVKSGPAFKLTYAEATERYTKGARCGGADAPDQVLGKADQHNEMQVGRDRVATWGFRFPQGTLLIRCRADHVEVTRTLK